MNISPHPISSKSFLRPQQIAHKLGVHKATIFRAIKRKELPFVKIGRQYFVPASFLENVQCLGKGHESYVSNG